MSLHDPDQRWNLASFARHFYAVHVNFNSLCHPIVTIAIALICSFPIAPALADVAPTIRAQVIDTDGIVSETQWRSASTWIWSHNHLRLQAAIEIPTHIASALTESGVLRGAHYKGPFRLQDDHLFLIFEMKGPQEIFKLDGRRTLRITSEFDHTNWMRTTSCREADVALQELKDEGTDAPSGVQAGAESGEDAFFISLACKPAKAGTWVEVASSDEVTLSFEPRAQVRVKGTKNGTAFWLPAGAHARVLSDVIVMGENGEATSRYELAASEKSSTLSHAPLSPALPILVAESRAWADSGVDSSRADRPSLGVNAQLMETHGARNQQMTGRTSLEIAVVARGEIEHWRGDFELPIRRLGAGLDSNGAASHLSWINGGTTLGWLTAGAQVAVLDVYTPTRFTVLAVSPSLEAHFASLYSVVLAPFDFNSSLSILRGRADLPLTSDRKNRLSFEALIARTWIQPQKSSWNVNGLTVGFVGEF